MTSLEHIYRTVLPDVPRSRSESKNPSSHMLKYKESKPTTMPIKIKKKVMASRNCNNKSMVVNDDFLQKIKSKNNSRWL